MIILLVFSLFLAVILNINYYEYRVVKNINSQPKEIDAMYQSFILKKKYERKVK